MDLWPVLVSINSAPRLHQGILCQILKLVSFQPYLQWETAQTASQRVATSSEVRHDHMAMRQLLVPSSSGHDTLHQVAGFAPDSYCMMQNAPWPLFFFLPKFLNEI